MAKRSTHKLLNDGLESYNSAPVSEDSFVRFAEQNFQYGIPAQFSRKNIRQPLLRSVLDNDRLSACAIWKVILRFMGDTPDYRGHVTTNHQPNMGSVMTRLYDLLGITASDRDLKRKHNITQGKKKEENEKEDAISKLRALRKGKGGTMRRLKSTLTSRFYKRKVDITIFNTLPLEDQLRSPMEQLHFIIGYGLLRPTLRDEIYCQVCKQLIRNPYQDSVSKGWLLLTMLAGSFAPSQQILKYVVKFLDDGPPVYSYNCKKNLQRTLQNGDRFQPPAFIELETSLQKTLMEISVTMMDGTSHTVTIDSATNAKELTNQLFDYIGLKDRFGFSLYISMYDKVASLGNGADHVLDAVSHCEQIHHELEGVEGVAPWRLFLRKEMFSPWESAVLDPVATGLVFAQVVRGIMLGEYHTDDDSHLAQLAAMQYYIEYGSEISEDGLTALLKSYIPESTLQPDNIESVRKWRKLIVRAHNKQFGEPGDDKHKPPPEKVKQELVYFAKTKWAMAFSRYYDVTKLEGPDWTHEELNIAVNWTGVFVLSNGELMYEISFPEIVRVTDAISNNSSAPGQVVTILLVNGAALKFASADGDDLRHLIEFMIDGLKQRSVYAIASEVVNGTDGQLTTNEGDIIFLAEPAGVGAMLQPTCMGRNDRTGKAGSLNSNSLYVLPTITKPSDDVLKLFKRTKLKLKPHSR